MREGEEEERKGRRREMCFRKVGSLLVCVWGGRGGGRGGSCK